LAQQVYGTNGDICSYLHLSLAVCVCVVVGEGWGSLVWKASLTLINVRLKD